MPEVTDPAILAKLNQGGGLRQVAKLPPKSTAGTGYGPPGTPGVSFIPGSGEDPAVIRRNAKIKAGIELAKELAGARGRSQIELGVDATKRERDKNKVGGAMFDSATALRTELEKQVSVKSYKNALASYASSMKAADNPAGDLNIIYAYAKILDPDSVVREGEQASVAGLGTVGQQVYGSIRKQLNGEGRLEPGLRRQLISEMRNRVASYDQGYNAERSRFRALADKQGIDSDLVVGPHLGDAYAKIENKYWRGDENLDALTFAKLQKAGLVGGGGGGGTGGTPGGGNGPVTGPTKTINNPATQAIVDQMIRQGMSADAINRVIVPAGLSTGVDTEQVARAQEFLRANPNYAGTFSNVVQEVPNSALSRVAGSPAGAGVLGAADGMLGGLLDEISALPASIASGRPYSQELADLNAAKQGAFEANPKSAFLGGLVGAGGQFLTGAGLLGGTQVAGAIGKAAPYIGSIAQGAISGAGQSNDSRALGALIGGGAAAAGYGAGELASIPVGAALRTQSGRSVTQFLQNLPKVGKAFGADLPDAVQRPSAAELAAAAAARKVDPAQIMAKLSEAADLGLPMTIADTAAQMRALAGSAVRRSPTAADLAEAVLTKRGRGQIDRLRNAVESDLGPVANIPQLSQDIMNTARTKAAPLYDEAYKQPTISTPELDSLLATPAGRQALSRARTIAANERRDPSDLGFALDGDGNAVLNPVNVNLHQHAAESRAAYDSSLASAQSAYDDSRAALAAEQRRARGGAAKGDAVARAQQRVELAKAELDAALNNTSDVDSSVSDLAAQPTPGMAASRRGYTTQTLDYTKRGLDDVIDNLPRGLNGRPIMDENYRAVDGVRSAFLREMDRINPAYRDARAAYAGPAQSREALAVGQDAYTMTPDEIRLMVKSRSPDQLSQMQLGYRGQLVDHANKVRDASNPFEATLGSPTARDRVEALYPGNPGNEVLFRRQEIERQLARNTNDILGNSKTAQRQIADQAFAESPWPSLGADALSVATGQVPTASAARALGAGKVKDMLTLGASSRAEAKAEGLAPILFEDNPSAAMEALNQIVRRVTGYRDYVDALRPKKLGALGAAAGTTFGANY